MVGIYKITSPTNKINIGQSWNIEKRHKNYRDLNCKKQTKLYNSLKKYGFENHKFEVIHELSEDTTQEILDEYEIFYIDYYKNCGFEMLNIRGGGSKGKLSQETKDKIRNNPDKARKASAALKGRKFSEEHKEKLRGPKSEAHKLKMSQASKGKPKSALQVQRMRIGKTGKGGKALICLNDGKIFNTIAEAAEYYKINPRSIDNILLGYSKCTNKKLTFKFKE